MMTKCLTRLLENTIWDRNAFVFGLGFCRKTVRLLIGLNVAIHCSIALGAEISAEPIFIDFEDAVTPPPICNGSVCRLFTCLAADPFAVSKGVTFSQNTGVCNFNYPIPIFDPSIGQAADGDFGLLGLNTASIYFNPSVNPELSQVTSIRFMVTAWFRNFSVFIDGKYGVDYGKARIFAANADPIEVASANRTVVTLSAKPGKFLNGLAIYVDPANSKDLPDGNVILDNITIFTGPDLDLLVSDLHASQPGAVVSSEDNLLQVMPNTPVHIEVPISGNGYQSPEARTVTVSLQAGNQIFSQSISLAEIQASETKTIPFSVTFGSQDIGVQTIAAIVNPGNVLREGNYSNNSKSTQVRVSNPLILQVDFPELENNPAYSQKLSGGISNLQAPLGALFNLRLQRVDAVGNKIPVQANYSLSNSVINPAIEPGEEPLFPNNVVVPFDQAISSTGKLFQALHLGTAEVKITPVDPNIPSARTNILIYIPDTVGQPEQTPDDLIVKYAHLRGIPPQLIKAIIRHESWSTRNQAIDQRSFRYEPGFDRRYVQRKTRNRDIAVINDPIFMPNEMRIDELDRVRQANLIAEDIMPREIYNMVDPDAEILRQISTGDNFVSADNIVRSNPRENFNIDPDSVDLDFTAQTTVASSYGYMQIMYEVAIDEESWKSPSGRNHPHELFFPEENIKTATRHLKRKILFPFVDANPNVLFPIQIILPLRRALQRYNGGNDPNYSSKVFNYVPRYRATPKGEVFLK